MAGRYLTAGLLLAAAALDLSRCGLLLADDRPVVVAAGLLCAGLAAFAVSLWTARGCRAGRRWSAWAALLIGAASAPQAALSGFRGLYTVPDTATAAVGVLLTVAVLATVGVTGPWPGPAADAFFPGPCGQGVPGRGPGPGTDAISVPLRDPGGQDQQPADCAVTEQPPGGKSG
jgi:hypothetical protein